MYQARLALLMCIPYINTGLDAEISIERLDDVAFETGGTPIELIQTKHHIDRIASLSNASPDLWKTLRVWSEAAKKDPSLPSRVRLALVTTGNAPAGSAASMLRPAASYPKGEKRDPKLANETLTKIAESSTNKELNASFTAFLALSDAMRSSLLSAIEILDGQPIITDLTEALNQALRLAAPSGKAKEVREALEGWWWPQVCAALVQSPSEPIQISQVEAKLDDIRDGLKRGALIAEFEHAEPNEIEYEDYDDFRFVHQLKIVGLGDNRVRFAKRDFYRAFSQRSKWTREHVVLDDEVEKFEQRLLEEWQPRFDAICEKHSGADSSDFNLKQDAQILYQWVENEARFPFRSLVARFLNVGSYHILANALKVGWHRDYLALCAEED